MLDMNAVVAMVLAVAGNLSGQATSTVTEPQHQPVLLAQVATKPAEKVAPKPNAAAPKPVGSAAAKPTEKPAPAASSSAPAAMTPEVAALVDRMQAFYEKTEDFRADFTQAYTYKTFKRTQTSSGKVIFKKPGLMRWDYEKPSARSFVLAGNKVYAHDPEARTLTVAAMDTSQLSASVTFLFGQGKLQDEFKITKGTCKDCKLGTLLVLDPIKPDPRFKQVRFEVDPKTAQVRRSIVIDPDGSENAITFSEMKTNQGVGREVFKLTPPSDTQVIDYTKVKTAQ